MYFEWYKEVPYMVHLDFSEVYITWVVSRISVTVEFLKE